MQKKKKTHIALQRERKKQGSKSSIYFLVEWKWHLKIIKWIVYFYLKYAIIFTFQSDMISNTTNLKFFMKQIIKLVGYFRKRKAARW